MEFKHGKIKVVCETTNRYGISAGFNHRAKLYIDGCYIRKDICQYYNRTWEKFTYASVLQKVLEKGRKELSAFGALTVHEFKDKYDLH